MRALYIYATNAMRETRAFTRVKQLPFGYIVTQRFAGMLFDNPLKNGYRGEEKVERKKFTIEI